MIYIVNKDIRGRIFGEFIFFRKVLSFFEVKIKIRKHMVFLKNLGMKGLISSGGGYLV